MTSIKGKKGGSNKGCDSSIVDGQDMDTVQTGSCSIIFDERQKHVCLKRDAAGSIEQGTLIYSQGPDSLTKMGGNKAAAVQTCIDKNLAPQSKISR